MSHPQWKTTVPPRPFELARVWKLAASAGCGKTFTVERCINELLASGVRPDEIMYVTFNRLPVQEFRARFPSFSKEQKRWWGTHHSVCLRLLRDSGLRPVSMGPRHWAEFGSLHGYDFAGDEDDAEDGDEAARLRNGVSLKRCDGQPLDDAEELFLSRLLSFESENNLISFDSMLADAMSRDLFPPAVRFVFVDEAQDNGSVQNAYWLRMLANNFLVAGFMLVGDDKQAINGFKGGNARSFLSFPADEWVSLDASYRCPPPVLAFANEIAGPIAERSPLVATSRADAPGSVRRRARLDHMVDDLRADVANGRSVLVLARTGRVVSASRGVLSRAGIPYHSSETDRIRRVFRAFHDIRETGLISDASMSALAPFSDASAPHVPGDLSLRCEYFDKVARKAFLDSRKNARRDVLDLADEDASGGIPVELALKRGFTDRFVMDVFWAATPDPSFFLGKNARRLVPLVSDWIDAYGIDYPAVNAMTVHAAKGAEADSVVLVGDISSFMREVEVSDSDNERRVWYVAATRSKDTLYIAHVSDNAGFSRFL